MEGLEAKLKAAQEEIKRMAQKGLDAKTMTTKDEKLRGIIKKIKD